MGAYYIDLPVFQRVYPIKLAENDVIVYEYLELHIFNPCRLFVPTFLPCTVLP